MINVHKINKNKFKSIYFSLNYTMNVDRFQNSVNPLLASILGKSNSKYKTQVEIEKYLDSLYGATFDINVEKFGDLYNVEFQVECINKKYLPKNTDVVYSVIEFLHDIVYSPNIVNNQFDENVLNREKEYILDKILSRKDDKLSYGVSKMEEILCTDEPFGMYLYGEQEIVEKLTSDDLIKGYEYLKSNSAVSFMVSGNLDGYDDIEEMIKSKFEKDCLNNVSFSDLKVDTSTKQIRENVEAHVEEEDTTQSVLSLGLRIDEKKENDFYVFNVYNAVLGSTPSSKLFQNFREKESLAYTVRSRYYRFKNILVIYAGIERQNYKRAVEVLKKELNELTLGNISDVEFNAAKESLVADLKEWDDSKVALSKMLLSNLLVKNYDVSIDEMIEKIKSVTKNQVIEAASRVKLQEIFIFGGDTNDK